MCFLWTQWETHNVNYIHKQRRTRGWPRALLPTTSNINCFAKKLTAVPIFQHCFRSSCKQVLPHNLFIITRHWLTERNIFSFFFVPRSNDLGKKIKIKGPVGGWWRQTMVVHLSDFWIKEMLVELLLHRWPAETANMCLCYIQKCSQAAETVWTLRNTQTCDLLKCQHTYTHPCTHTFYPFIWQCLHRASAQQRDTSCLTGAVCLVLPDYSLRGIHSSTPQVVRTVFLEELSWSVQTGQRAKVILPRVIPLVYKKKE